MAKYSKKKILSLIPGFLFFLHCWIVLDYNHLSSEEVAFYKLL